MGAAAAAWRPLTLSGLSSQLPGILRQAGCASCTASGTSSLGYCKTAAVHRPLQQSLLDCRSTTQGPVKGRAQTLECLEQRDNKLG
jgi:hypothetical protein